MVKIKRALISVSDKTGIVEFAKGLSKLGVEILSTGGTARLLKEAGLSVIEVSTYTGFPEMLDGRVKTLHPKIHAGLLALREKPEHMKTLQEHNIGLIDMVVVNLYPFEEVIHRPNVTIEEAIENIDIGGPSMLRSAAKNHKSVAVVCNPARYNQVIEDLNKNNGTLSEDLMRELAIEVFARTSQYDGVIYEYLNKQALGLRPGVLGFPDNLTLEFTKLQGLRYGENPHQKAAFYREDAPYGLANARQLQGKELSFNNLLDLSAALSLIREFKNPAAVIIKHNNPCGVAEAKTLIKAFRDAWACDSLSAFGSIVGLNRPVDLETAKVIIKAGFVECILAPKFSKEAQDVFKDKKNVRLLELDFNTPQDKWDIKKVEGGMLFQERDSVDLDLNRIKFITQKRPTKLQMSSLLFGWKVAKYVKSNAIILTKGTKTVGIGAGQMSRVDACVIAVRKAGDKAGGLCLSSDAFFPKADSIAVAKRAGVKAIIQPGGSIADDEVIKAANKAGIAMVFTGVRHFRH